MGNARGGRVLRKYSIDQGSARGRRGCRGNEQTDYQADDKSAHFQVEQFPFNATGN